MTKTFKQSFYESWIEHAFLNDDYNFVIQSLPKLHDPIFSLKAVQQFVPDLTYRKVNEWENKGLVSPHRETEETGWRVFTWVEVIKLNIIADLRKLGFEIEQTKKMFDGFGDQHFKDRKFNALEYFIVLCVSGEKILLVIDDENAYFLTEKEVLLSHFSLDKSASKIIILPLFSYIEKMKDQSEITVYRPHSLASSLFKQQNTAPTDKEEQILELIKSNDYRKITVKKREGGSYTVSAGSYRNGELTDRDVIEAVHRNNFQTVKIARKNGKIISLECEKTIRV